MRYSIDKKILILTAVLLLISAAAFGCAQKTATDEPEYICGGSELIMALQAGEKTVYVGDISFDTQTEIRLNYPVRFIGKEKKSTLENVNFTIIGTNVAAEDMEISFENIIFDGKTDKNAIQFEEGKTFYETFDETSFHRCFEGTVGYYTLNIDNCEIRNYLCDEGPAIYVGNDANYREGKKAINLVNTKVYDNISNYGTVRLASDVLTTKIDSCDFYGNTGRAGQGISIANGKSTITNTDVHDNGFFRFVYYTERQNPAKYHDDVMEISGQTIPNLCSCAGAVFIGGSNATIDSCNVYNNTAIYGGGLCVKTANTVVGDEKIDVKNTVIKNNTALIAGGGIYLMSGQGETISFINCKIVGNSAEKGSILYTNTGVPHNAQRYGGNVRFIFCTMAGDGADDGGTFGFRDLLKPELGGKITLKGCFVLDNGVYGGDGEEYNYIATAEQAVSDGVITENDILTADEKNIYPKKGSDGDISVPANEYSHWDSMFNGAAQDRDIGYAAQEENGGAVVYWLAVIPLAVIAVAVLLILGYKKARKAETAQTAETPEPAETEEQDGFDCEKYPFDEIVGMIEKSYGELLTKTEITVTAYMLYGNSRKEIANRLFISDETVKWHLSNIYKKLGISSKAELKATVANAVLTK